MNEFEIQNLKLNFMCSKTKIARLDRVIHALVLSGPLS